MRREAWVVYSGGVVGGGAKPKDAVYICVFYDFSEAMDFIATPRRVLGSSKREYFWINREVI